MMSDSKTRIRKIRVPATFVIIVTITLFSILEVFLLRENRLLRLENKLYKIERDQILRNFWDRHFITTDEFNLEINNDTILLSIGGFSHVALWISDRQCGSCVDFALSKLNDLPDSLKENVIIFSDYENPRLRKIVNERISSEFTVVEYHFSDKGSTYNTPFLAFISPNLVVSKIFYPEKELPTLTDYYLERIKSDLN